MNKLIRLSPTGIEYGDYAWNFASGCGNNVDGKCKGGGFRCWAYPITQRFADRYPNGFKPTIYPEALLSPLHLKKPSRILCAFMGDLFWDCPEFNPDRKIHSLMPSGKASITMSLKGWIFTTMRQCPQHTFLFLTKNPKRLIDWGKFPDNCWVGVSATNSKMAWNGYADLRDISASIKYLSLEPLLEAIDIRMFENFRGIINQIIIGSQTKPYKPPKIEHVREIVQACDKAGVKVFLKENLKPLLEEAKFTDSHNLFWRDGYYTDITHPEVDLNLRQELPTSTDPKCTDGTSLVSS